MHRPFVALLIAGAVAVVAARASAETAAPPPDASVLTREIDAGVQELAGALRAARARRDTALAAALSDRLSQAHAASRRARELRDALVEATEAATRAVRLTELRTMRARVRRLVESSQEPEAARASGDTRVTFVVDASLPTNEPPR